MNRHHVPIARIFGISIGLDYSWFLIFILMTWSLADGYYPSLFPNWSPTLRWVIAGVSAIMLFASVLLHELGHSVIAQRYGIAVRRITLFIFGGVAEIGAEPPSAAAEFWIALAGPVVSGGLALLFGVLGTFTAHGTPLMALLAYVAYVNGALAVFNLIPGFPLDGGRILRAVVWEVTHSLPRATLVAATAGRIVAFLFILWGVSQIFAGRVGNGLWIAFIGWFLESAAAAEVQRQVLARRLGGHTVAEAMNRQYAAVPPNILLQDLVDRHILGSGRRSVVVTQDSAVQGLVTLHQIREVPREAWTSTTVGKGHDAGDVREAGATGCAFVDGHQRNGPGRRESAPCYGGRPDARHAQPGRCHRVLARSTGPRLLGERRRNQAETLVVQRENPH